MEVTPVDKEPQDPEELENTLEEDEKEQHNEEHLVEDSKHHHLDNEKIKTQRKTLPIFQYRNDILKTVEDCQLLILVGETGSGKSTQLAQYFYEAGYGKKGRIGVTQPRRVGAVSLARRVSEELDCYVGDTVGFAVRFSDKTSHNTKIKYMTDGTLLRECLLDPLLKEYSVIILDEAHERSVHTDILFGLMKTTIQKRSDLKVLITSATLDDVKFSQFFHDCPTFFVPGRSFPVDIFYTERRKSSDYIDAAIDTAIQLHFSEGPGDILIFLTGQQEIEKTCSRLKKKLEETYIKREEDGISNDNVLDMIILPLYAALPPSEQVKIFEPTPSDARKVVIATNIAETSLTVEGVVYVIDPGYVKQKMYNPRTGMESLEVVPISKVAAQQRAGRAGRTRAGKCYRLYTTKTYEEMDDATVPEIQRSNLSTIVLTLKALGVKDVVGFQFIDQPDPWLVIQAVKHLYQLGALDEDGELTELGKQMSAFPLDPGYSRMLLASVDEKCSEDMLSLISMMSVENFFYRPSNKDQQDIAEVKRRELYEEADSRSSSDLIGDHILLLHIYNTWKKNRKSQSWSKEYFIQNRLLEEADDIRNQLLDIMKQQRIEILSTSRGSTVKFDRLTRAMCYGLYMNAAKKLPQQTNKKGHVSRDFMYVAIHQKLNAFVHPMSLLLISEKESPEWVIYSEMISTSRPFMRMVVGIRYEWVEPLYVKRQKVDINRLVGRNVREMFAAVYMQEEKPQEPQSEADRVAEMVASKMARRNDDKSVDAARERFLRRKAEQQMQQQQKKKKT